MVKAESTDDVRDVQAIIVGVFRRLGLLAPPWRPAKQFNANWPLRDAGFIPERMQIAFVNLLNSSHSNSSYQSAYAVLISCRIRAYI